MKRIFSFVVILGFPSSCAGPQRSEFKHDVSDFDCTEIEGVDLRHRCQEAQDLIKQSRAAIENHYDEYGLQEYRHAYYDNISVHYKGHVGIDDAVQQLSDFSVIFSGDEHQITPVMDTHILLLNRLQAHFGSDRLVCALEMDRQWNKQIDAFYRKQISEDEIVNVLKEESTFLEQDLRRYLRACYLSNIPLIAVDIEQFDGMTILHRDQQIAKNITELFHHYQGRRKIFAPYGGLHLGGPDKLPALLAKAGIQSYQFLNLAPAALHWRCADQIGSESEMKNYACLIDGSNSYVSSQDSLLERYKRILSVIDEERRFRETFSDQK